jgi:hypothetical protein
MLHTPVFAEVKSDGIPSRLGRAELPSPDGTEAQA